MVSVSELQAYVLTTNTTCGEDNGTATVFASEGTGNYSYSWLTGGSGDMIDNLAKGEYAVLVDDGECVVLVNGIVGFEEPPVIEWDKITEGARLKFFRMQNKRPMEVI